jgi:hypothetical protein
LGSRPVGSHDEQSAAFGSAEHAGERAAIEFEPIQDPTTLGDPHTAPMPDVGIPSGAVAVEADAVGRVVADARPDPAVGQQSVAGDIKTR